MNRLLILVFTLCFTACPSPDPSPSDVGAGMPDSGAIAADTGPGGASDTGAAAADAQAPPIDASEPPADVGRPPVDVSDLLECTAAMQCQLVPSQCCAPCGAPEAEQLVALAGRQAGQARERYCAGQNPNNCPRCPEFPARETLRATCLQNSCTLVDLEQESFTGCSADSDCTLTLSMCCDSCTTHGADDFIAVRQDQLQNARQAYCGDAPPMCPACIGRVLPGLSATCVAGTCNVDSQP
jgi:hypothetical protein